MKPKYEFKNQKKSSDKDQALDHDEYDEDDNKSEHGYERCYTGRLWNPGEHEFKVPEGGFKDIFEFFKPELWIENKNLTAMDKWWRHCYNQNHFYRKIHDSKYHGIPDCNPYAWDLLNKKETVNMSQQFKYNAWDLVDGMHIFLTTDFPLWLPKHREYKPTYDKILNNILSTMPPYLPYQFEDASNLFESYRVEVQKIKKKYK